MQPTFIPACEAVARGVKGIQRRGGWGTLLNLLNFILRHIPSSLSPSLSLSLKILGLTTPCAASPQTPVDSSTTHFQKSSSFYPLPPAPVRLVWSKSAASDKRRSDSDRASYRRSPYLSTGPRHAFYSADSARVIFPFLLALYSRVVRTCFPRT
ncbi:hypothetical protein B0F90DRAFT_919150 [Multifurca ochricompacta]|uniref:Uncharacterized protein n=1 Tax=Multifurca ochricompacta TaxID=376703 RepID=A0AAD4M0Q7_9AGAM|nr:hypothetical protein B0F90DRAFT_919150 [Multifurca ochricompacta]